MKIWPTYILLILLMTVAANVVLVWAAKRHPPVAIERTREW